ncbi:hypothetical protein ACTOWA_00425 [Herbaspirillum seropedicae]|uniref:hypothetical protein n=1 Tax=Herbaspirillum seropedicae TaxID=964 RepID=UPI00285A664B|nr:hypothetical protein [Herbaspirillum seropedicae]MDR6397945.1 hypothetical protein [Herbaspirillum seropedicae]
MNQALMNLSRDEKSVLLYAETCMVDSSGLLESVRLNGEDLAALKRLQDAGLLNYGRVPSELLQQAKGKTYWVTFTERAWDIAHQLRRQRAEKPNTLRQAVDSVIAERASA